jgi:hypothetical protein
MKISEAKTVYDLFNEHPERWIQNATALDEQGNEVIECGNLENACKFCVLVAIYYIYGAADEGMKMARKLRDLLPIPQITIWQDRRSLTFEKMLAKVKKAGI